MVGYLCCGTHGIVPVPQEACLKLSKMDRMRTMKKRIATNYLYFGLILILALLMIYSGLRILESTVWSKMDGDLFDANPKTITVEGISYFPRQDITVFMVLGIDKYGEMQSSEYHRNDGDADMIALLIFNETEETYTVLTVNRDAMVEMPVLGIFGQQAGTSYSQLALAYTYGTGLEDSCENVKQTLQTLIPGLTVDHYLAMNMDAIGLLNDAVGGVTVTVTDDFSEADSSISLGTVTLNGQQAISYVRTRKGVGNQLNLSRMERQKEYIRSFMQNLKQMKNTDNAFIVSTYADISPYIVTDCSSTVITTLSNRYANYELKEIISLAGENHLGEEYYEFYVDEDALLKLRLALLYIQK